MIKQFLIYWFKKQAAKAARQILAPNYSKNEIRGILDSYWKRYKKLRPEVPATPTIGGSLMVHLAAMSTAFYQELKTRGENDETTTKLFYDIAWKVYQKMGKFSWSIAGRGTRKNHERLRKATDFFRKFPFNSPSYQWKDIATNDNTVGFDCFKCPVAEYFQSKGLSQFCAATWCALDFPLAEMWNAKLERTGSIAGGADKCDFRWIPNNKNKMT